MAPQAEIINSVDRNNSFGVTVNSKDLEAVADPAPQPQNDYLYTYDNRDGFTPETLGPDWAYTVAEHILWAPRKIRVASIGAGASGIMLCYKKEKEFGDDIDLVVYDRECIEMLRGRRLLLKFTQQDMRSAAVSGMQTSTPAAVVMSRRQHTSSHSPLALTGPSTTLPQRT